VTSRDGTDDLGLERKLQIQPLTNAKVKAFLQSRLPGYAQAQIKELSDRVKDFGQTPLMVWMLFSIFRQNGDIPTTRGEAYRAFTMLYAERAKEGIDLDESRGLLSKLAFELMHAEKPTDFRPDIGEVDAQNLLGSEKALKQLVRNHLLQVKGKLENRRISFCHQSLQEYYAAEALLVMLQNEHPDVMDDKRLQYFYLNYLKWTEPISIALSLVENEAQTLRVVKLALKVDWMLGARLAGGVKPRFQQQTISMVSALDVPDWLKASLLGEARLDYVIPALLKLVENSDPSVRSRAATALDAVRSETAIPALLKLMEDSVSRIRFKAAVALDNIRSEVPVPALLKLAKHSDFSVRAGAAIALGKTSSETAVPNQLNLVRQPSSNVPEINASTLSDIKLKALATALLRLTEHSDSKVRGYAAFGLGYTAFAYDSIWSETAISALLRLVEDPDSYVRGNVAAALKYIESETAIPALLKLMEDSDPHVRGDVAETLASIGSETAISALLKLVQDSDSYVRSQVVIVLGNVGSGTAIPALLKLVQDSDSDVRGFTAKALGEIAEKHTNEIAQHLPHLLTLIPTDSGETAHHVILTIQANCQFYNYAIAQWKLAPHTTERSPTTTQYNIGHVGIFNAGDVTNQGNQNGETPNL